MVFESLADLRLQTDLFFRHTFGSRNRRPATSLLLTASMAAHPTATFSPPLSPSTTRSKHPKPQPPTHFPQCSGRMMHKRVKLPLSTAACCQWQMRPHCFTSHRPSPSTPRTIRTGLRSPTTGRPVPAARWATGRQWRTSGVACHPDALLPNAPAIQTGKRGAALPAPAQFDLEGHKPGHEAKQKSGDHHANVHALYHLTLSSAWIGRTSPRGSALGSVPARSRQSVNYHDPCRP